MSVSEGIELEQITIGLLACTDVIAPLGDDIENIKSLEKNL